MFLVQSVFYFRRLSLRGRFGLIYVVAAPISGVLIYLLFGISSDYSSIFASAILLYYLFLYIYMSKTDPLTGLSNRQCFYRDSKVLSSKITAVASVDMNELKWINDTKGHSAGDAALKTVADCITVGSGRQKAVYRVGGDEFVVFYFGKSAEDAEADIERMRAKLADTPYVCAFGYAMHPAGEDVDITLSKADEAMYADKSALKRAVLEKGGKLHRRCDDLK